jgi:segregation and condensation protein A
MMYELRLPNFEGPLDLFLHLVNKAKIQPKDIFVSQITEQYLSYIKKFGLTDLDTASEFLQMAATLLYIKSRSLLPNLLPEEEEDVLLLEDRLVERLNEYKKYKETSEVFKRMEGEARGQYYKLPEELAPDENGQGLIHADVRALLSAYLRLVAETKEEGKKRPDIVIHAEHISMQTQMYAILGRLAIKDTMDFAEFFLNKPSREELAVTFYALLELWAQGRIGVRQAQAFGKIEVFKRKDRADG